MESIIKASITSHFINYSLMVNLDKKALADQAFTLLLKENTCKISHLSACSFYDIQTAIFWALPLCWIWKVVNGMASRYFTWVFVLLDRM